MPEKISFLCDFQDEIGGNDDGDNLDGEMVYVMIDLK